MAMTEEKIQARADEAAGLLSAMSNPRRLHILTLLLHREMTVGALADAVGLSQSALSQHLAKLRGRDLVSTRRDAQTIHYSLASPAVPRIFEALEDIYFGNG